MRCLFVTTALPPERIGGAEAYCVQLAQNLGSIGVEVDLLGRNPTSSVDAVERIPHGNWIRLGTRLHPYFGYLSAMHGWLSEHADDYDVVQFFDMNVSSAVGLHATRRCSVTRICRDESVVAWSDTQLDSTRVPLLAAWAKQQLRTADQYVVASTSEARSLEELGLPAERVTYIPNGIDTVRFSEVPMAGSFDVVCPARLRVEKNHVGLLRVFSRVRESVPRARLLLPGDGPMLPEIRTAIEAVGLQRDVELLGHVDDMPALYARSRAVCLLSEAEGPSLGVLEGASRGRPSVVTDVGGLKDSVVDGVTGFRVGYGDEKAAERALVMLMTDDSVCRSMGQAAAAFVREERSLSRVAKTYANYLQEVSKRRQRS